ITIIKFFISVKNGNIFDSNIEGRTFRLGILYIILNVIDFIHTAIMIKEANSTIEIEGYKINYGCYDFSVNSHPTLYIGFILLIISEVFRMARKLKEEQEFTI
ncbi:MAG: DUF2975 domain-containing protein, partial [Bacteroidaceae bacterium]|nr:DUF2975 domain-containing protein [Bacteroidaceae bacterium]